VRPSHERSYERVCHDGGVEAFLLHLREPRREAVRAELMEPRLERAIGVIYRPESELASHYFQAVLPLQFDEWIWFDTTSRDAARAAVVTGPRDPAVHSDPRGAGRARGDPSLLASSAFSAASASRAAWIALGDLARALVRLPRARASPALRFVFRRPPPSDLFDRCPDLLDLPLRPGSSSRSPSPPPPSSFRPAGLPAARFAFLELVPAGHGILLRVPESERTENMRAPAPRDPFRRASRGDIGEPAPARTSSWASGPTSVRPPSKTAASSSEPRARTQPRISNRSPSERGAPEPSAGRIPRSVVGAPNPRSP
jgi:hypothetical protein